MAGRRSTTGAAARAASSRARRTSSPSSSSRPCAVPAWFRARNRAYVIAQNRGLGLHETSRPATISCRQGGLIRAARTAESVSVVSHSARSAGAPTASGPSGCSRGRRTSRRGWRRRRRRTAAGPSRRRAVVDGGVHPAPRVQRGDRGVAAQRQPTPASARSANGLRRRRGPHPAGRRTCPASAPGGVERRLHAGDDPPARPAVRGAVHHLQVLQPVPAARTARAELVGGRAARDGAATASSPMQWKPACTRRGCRHQVLDEMPRLEAQLPRSRRSVYGRCSAAVREPNAPSRTGRRQATAPTPGRGRRRPAPPVTPVADHPRPELGADSPAPDQVLGARDLRSAHLVHGADAQAAAAASGRAGPPGAGRPAPSVGDLTGAAWWASSRQQAVGAEAGQVR